MEYFDHKNEWKLAIIGRIISCGLVFCSFVGHMKGEIPVFYHCPKKKRRLSHFRNLLKIRVLEPFSSKAILLNQISGFIGQFSN